MQLFMVRQDIWKHVKTKKKATAMQNRFQTL